MTISFCDGRDEEQKEIFSADMDIIPQKGDMVIHNDVQYIVTSGNTEFILGDSVMIRLFIKER